MATLETSNEHAQVEVQKAEKEVATFDIAPASSKSSDANVREMTEKLKKPTIGASLVIFMALNIAMLFVGSTTVHECTVRPIIPIYLIVAGVLGVVTKATPIANYNTRYVFVDRILYVLYVVEFIWMILGSYWIYSIYQPNYDKTHAEYCDKTAYLLAFWLLTIHYVFLALSVLIPCCIMCSCCIVTAYCLAND